VKEEKSKIETPVKPQDDEINLKFLFEDEESVTNVEVQE
jgi:hypothetical protein